MKRALTLLVLLTATHALAGPKWETIDGYPDLMRLVDSKIRAVVADAPPYPPVTRACLEVPSDQIPGCPHAHKRRLHVDFPAGDDGLVMIDSAKLALAQGRRVIVHLDTSDTEPNQQGELRCRVVRLVVHRKSK